jgi:hypothetical protein
MKQRRVLKTAGPFTLLSYDYEMRADSPIEKNQVSKVPDRRGLYARKP